MTGSIGLSIAWTSGRSFEEAGRIVPGHPGEGDDVIQVVGQLFGAAALAEDLGERPGVNGQVGLDLGHRPDRQVERGDRLGVPAQPGQAKSPG